MKTGMDAEMFVYSVVSRMHSKEGHNSQYYQSTEVLARCVEVVDWEFLATAQGMKWTTNADLAQALCDFSRLKMVGKSGGAALIAAAATVDAAVAEVPGMFGEWVAHGLVDNAEMERMHTAMQYRKPLEWDSMLDMVHEIENGQWVSTRCFTNQRRPSFLETGDNDDAGKKALAQKVDAMKLWSQIKRDAANAAATEKKIADMFCLLGTNIVYEFGGDVKDMHERDHDIQAACDNLRVHLLDANGQREIGSSKAASEAWGALHKQPDGLLEQLQKSVFYLTTKLPLYIAVMWRDLEGTILNAARQVKLDDRTQTVYSVQAVCDAARALTVVHAVTKMAGLAGADVHVGEFLCVRRIYAALCVALHTANSSLRLPSNRSAGT